MRAGRTKWTPMAPVSGPLTHGVPCTKPSEIATLISLKRSVAVRTLSINGDWSFFHCPEFCGLGPAYDGWPPARRSIANGSIANVRRRKMLIGVPLRFVMECSRLNVLAALNGDHHQN